ncbi:hypothetical protein ACWGDE_29750 [Streptomyces sp. NPDC054956]
MSETRVKKSVTMRRSLAEQIEDRVGAGGFSGFVDAAAEHWLALLKAQEGAADYARRDGAPPERDVVEEAGHTCPGRQLERERLNELIRDSEAVNGPADLSAVVEKRSILRGETATGPTPDERAARAEQARAALQAWNGYAPTAADERELDAELDRRLGEAGGR